jgi:hypothetical protein
MPHEWYRYETKVIELAEFLVQSDEIKNTDELLDYFKHPERYTGVWNIYEKEILGDEPVSHGFLKKGLLHRPKQIPDVITSIDSCACAK